MKTWFAVTAFFLSLNSWADAPNLAARDEVVKFLQEKVIGKTVAATTNKEDNDFQQTWTWTNLSVSDMGFSFEELVQIKQTVYELDENKKRTGEGVVRNRGYAMKNSLGLRQGPNVLLGLKTPTLSTFRDINGSGYTIDAMRVENDKLYIEFTDAVPTSWPQSPPATGFDQIKSKHTETIWVDADGKLNRIFTQVTSYVDIATGKVLSTKPEWKSEQKEL